MNNSETSNLSTNNNMNSSETIANESDDVTRSIDVAEDYQSSLQDLNLNSKPLINMLTMLADDYIAHASVIVDVVEKHILKVLFIYILTNS